jgi:hypothetical protein
MPCRHFCDMSKALDELIYIKGLTVFSGILVAASYKIIWGNILDWQMKSGVTYKWLTAARIKPSVSHWPLPGNGSQQRSQLSSLLAGDCHTAAQVMTDCRLSLSLTLRPTISRPFCLGINTRFLLSESYGFDDVGRSFWREDGPVVYNCCWRSPEQSFSGPSPVGLAIIFYCLRFETSLFVTSYDSQGYGGGIRPCLHTGD